MDQKKTHFHSVHLNNKVLLIVAENGAIAWLWMRHDTSKQERTHQGYINPFTAPACKISGLKDAGTRLQTVDFSSPITHLLSSTCRYEKENKKGNKCFKFRTITGRFQVTSWQ